MQAENITNDSLLKLIEKRDQLDQAITAVRALIEVAGSADFLESAIQAIYHKALGGAEAPAHTQASSSEIATINSDTFFGKSIMDATAEYLAMMKKPRSIQEIIDALKLGGYHFSTHNPVPSVMSTLNRSSNSSNGIVVRTGPATYGLAEWYQSRPRNKKKLSSASKTNDLSSNNDENPLNEDSDNAIDNFNELSHAPQ